MQIYSIKIMSFDYIKLTYNMFHPLRIFATQAEMAVVKGLKETEILWIGERVVLKYCKLKTYI